MSYDLEKVKAGRQPLTITEIDLDKCANVYGESHSNLLTQPEDFSHADWAQVGTGAVTVDDAVAPDGALTADLLTDTDTDVDETYWQQSDTVSDDSLSRNISVFIKPGTATKSTLAGFCTGGSAVSVRADIDWSALTISTGSLTPLPNGWYRASIVVTNNSSGNTTFVSRIYPASDNVTITGTAHVWGMQTTLNAILYDYGVATCTAALSAGSESYNTFKTCQDTPNYNNRVPKTYRFCDSPKPPVGINAIPCADKVTTAPTKITPGKGLGHRANVSIDFVDFPHDDRGIDPYVLTRNYDTAIGTFFGKLYARNPFYQGRALRVKSGYVSEDGFDENDFVTKHYVIEKFDRNSKTGKVRIVAKDPLKLADDERAQCPVATSGALDGAISDVSTSLLLTAGTGSEYGGSGHVRINDEIIKFDSRSTDTLNGLTRAQHGSTAAAHSDGDSAQLCKEFLEMNVVDIVSELFVDFAGISASFINTVDWDQQKSRWLSAAILTTLISKPTGVNKLVKELTDENLFDNWWDEKIQLIELKSIIPDNLNIGEAEFNDDNHLVGGSVSVVDSTLDRFSQVWIYYGVKDFTQSLNSAENFLPPTIKADADGESSAGYGDRRVKTIFSRWITSGAYASQSASRLLRRHKDVQHDIKFDMDAKDSDLWTGDHFLINTQFAQDVTGAGESKRMQVLSVQEKELGSHFSYQAQSVQFTGKYGFIAPNALSAVTWSTATDEQKQSYGFIALDTGLFADGSEGYKIL